MPQTPLVKMVALRPHKVHSRRVAVGEEFEVKPREALLYRKLGWARDAGAAPPEAGTYSRADVSVAPVAPTLEGMTKAKLLEVATSEGVEHTGRETNAALIQRIKEARSAR